MIHVSRRAVLGALAAAPLAACAGGPAREMVQVNLTSPALPPPPGAGPDEADGAVRTGFDAVRRMTVEATIEGQGPYRFVVDTGANRTVLSAEVAEALGLATSGQAMVHGIAGVLPSRTVMVRQLTVGGLLSRRVRMPVLPRQYLGADGLLGVDVLARRRATLDFARQSFSLASAGAERTVLARATEARKADEPVPNEVVVPARHRFGQLTIVDAELGGVPVTAFLDSGAEITVGNSMLQRALGDRPGLINERPLRVELVSATGQLVAGEMSVVPPLRLGGVRLGNLTCVFADLHTFRIWQLDDRPALLVGVDVMRHFDSIELDFADRNVKFRSGRFARTDGAPTRP
jgi:hypothetical protein